MHLHHEPSCTAPRYSQIKRIVLARCLLLALALALLLAGCGTSAGRSASQASANGSQNGSGLSASSSLPAASAPNGQAVAPSGSAGSSAAGTAVTSTVGTAASSVVAPGASPPAPSGSLSGDPSVEAPSAAHPAIALTFDDGPSMRDTGKLLDLLKAEQVPATFFVLGGQIDAGRHALVQRAASEGHEVGNHTYSHVTLRKLDAARVRSELARTSDLITRVTGKRPTLMRPPTGAYDDTTIAVARDLGLALVNWSYQSCPEDWNHRGDPKYIADYVVSKAANGHIVLLHDTNSSTMDAMPAMIQGLKARGFRFMTVSQLLAYAGAGEPTPGKAYFQLSIKK